MMVYNLLYLYDITMISKYKTEECTKEEAAGKFRRLKIWLICQLLRTVW